MAHKQSYLTVMLNKGCYSSEIAVIRHVRSHSLQHQHIQTTTVTTLATVDETL